MSETTAQPILKKRRLRLPFYEEISQNPVVLKELRGRMRGGRAFIMISIYLFMLAAIVGLIYFGFIASEQSAGSMSGNTGQALGKSVFAVIVSLELILVSFVAPALTASGISGEREHQTYDLLRTTLLPARSLVLGKLVSALSFILLLLFAAFPLQTLAYLFGGVSISEIVVASLVLVVTALAFSALGIFFSSFLKRTLVSTVMAYVASIMIVFGIPMMILTGLILLQSSLYGLNNVTLSTVLEGALIVAGWIIICLNPLATAVATEIILVSDQSLWYTQISLPNGGASIYVISPWIGFVVLYLLISVLLIVASIFFVRRVEK